jgi:hypothetical protein
MGEDMKDMNAATIISCAQFKTVDYDAHYWEPIPLQLYMIYMKEGDTKRASLLLYWAYLDKLKKQAEE